MVLHIEVLLSVRDLLLNLKLDLMQLICLLLQTFLLLCKVLDSLLLLLDLDV